eukprot:1345363-Amorphochlora_amoeboformis.AAC.2
MEVSGSLQRRGGYTIDTRKRDDDVVFTTIAGKFRCGYQPTHNLFRYQVFKNCQRELSSEEAICESGQQTVPRDVHKASLRYDGALCVLHSRRFHVDGLSIWVFHNKLATV